MSEAATAESINLTATNNLDAAGIDAGVVERLCERIRLHIDWGWYPGASIALARDSEVIFANSFGNATIDSELTTARAADNDTLWLLYSQTKPVVSSAVWALAERGLIRFHDTVAEYVPDFARYGKDQVTIAQVLSHQGGFPNGVISTDVWEDHDLMREQVCDFTLEWEPGARVSYHGWTGHWVQAMLMEAVTGKDYRDVVRELILEPLGIDAVRVGVPDSMHDRVVGAYARNDRGVHEPIPDRNGPEFYRAGVPGGGGYATASAMAMFYQMLLNLGVLDGRRVLSPRTIQYGIRNYTGERIDEKFAMPMHRALGVHVRGETPNIRGLGSTAAASTFGHGGVGTSYTWADPETHVSFTYLTNSQLPEPLHSQRLDEIMTIAHATVVRL